jgi:hypothetical protein
MTRGEYLAGMLRLKLCLDHGDTMGDERIKAYYAELCRYGIHDGHFPRLASRLVDTWEKASFPRPADFRSAWIDLRPTRGAPEAPGKDTPISDEERAAGLAAINAALESMGAFPAPPDEQERVDELQQQARDITGGRDA